MILVWEDSGWSVDGYAGGMTEIGVPTVFVTLRGAMIFPVILRRRRR